MGITATESMNPVLQRLKREIVVMPRKKQDGREKPHKLFILLAVLDLVDDGLLDENKIIYNEELVRRFNRYFHAGSGPTDWLQPTIPFFHLKSSSFWKHKPKLGREEQYAAIKKMGAGARLIRENIDYAYLSDEVYALVQDYRMRSNLRNFIIALFPPQAEKLFDHD